MHLYCATGFGLILHDIWIHFSIISFQTLGGGAIDRRVIPDIWINEQRIWIIMSVTCYLYGSMDAIMKKIGMREASFLTTDKVMDDEKEKLYQMGKFDFRTSTPIIAPLVILVILNMASFMLGLVRVIATGDWDKMLVQVVLSFYILIMSLPIIEGMTMRKDQGRVPSSITGLSIVVAMALLTVGSIVLMD